MYRSSWQYDPLGPRTLNVNYARLALSLLLESQPASEEALSPGQRALLRSEHTSRCTLGQWHELVDLAEHRLGSRDLVPLMAERFMPWHAGLLGFTLMTSKTIEQMAGLLRRYNALLSDVFVLEIGLSDGKFFLRLRDAGHERSPRLARLLLCTWAERLCWLTGQADLKIDAHFEGPGPPELKPYRWIFGGQLRFDQAENAIYGDVSYTKLPVVSHDASCHQILRSQTESLVTQMFPERARLIDRLNSIIHAHLDNRMMSLEEAALAMGLPARMLQRRLDEAGVSFRQMVDQARRLMAEKYLCHTDMPLAEMAVALGFADHASFNRAFKRWSGSSPGSYRRSKRQVPPPAIGMQGAR